MGGLFRGDLTADITHLIVGAHFSPKYRYVAKNRPDIRVMTLEWIQKIWEHWIGDQPIHLEEMETQYARPALHSLRICITGVEDRECATAKGVPDPGLIQCLKRHTAA